MAWAAVAKFLLHIARKVLEKVLIDLIANSRVVQDLVQKVLGYIPTLQNAWEGPDCEAFSNDVRNEMIPEIRKLGDAILNIRGTIDRSKDNMDTVDQNAVSNVNTVREAFDRVRL